MSLTEEQMWVEAERIACILNLPVRMFISKPAYAKYLEFKRKAPKT